MGRCYPLIAQTSVPANADTTNHESAAPVLDCALPFFFCRTIPSGPRSFYLDLKVEHSVSPARLAPIPVMPTLSAVHRLPAL